jgi:hypothetical protein
MRRTRARRKALTPAEVDPAWVPAPPLLAKVIEYAPEDPTLPIAAMNVEQAAAQSLKISGRLNVGGSEPWDVKLRDAVATLRRVGGSSEDLDRALRAGARSAGGSRRLPAFLADMSPEESFAYDRHHRDTARRSWDEAV